jgi:type 1 fimbriae regulatory protein FimB
MPKQKPSQEKLGTTSQCWTAATINFLTQDEMRRLLDAIDSKRDSAISLLAYRHGLRASEIGMLSTADLDVKQYRVRIHRLKNSLEGLHPLQPDEVKALKAYLKERNSNVPALFLSRNTTPISRRRLDELMKHYGQRAGIPESKRHFHALKHSIATHLLDAGADLRFVQDWIGHASIRNTVIYAQLTSRRRDEEARKVFASQWVV